MADAWWKYLDPAAQAFHQSKYKWGCHACTKSQYDKSSMRWKCIIEVPEFPNLGKNECEFWRKK
ncbi:MAG: hypothetical protein NUV74_05495 [Candidatus Brocadiaceae bacterium]|nr:hypothetical protein [Candidatus Brocadiaceae bacterium]